MDKEERTVLSAVKAAAVCTEVTCVLTANLCRSTAVTCPVTVPEAGPELLWGETTTTALSSALCSAFLGLAAPPRGPRGLPPPATSGD